MSYSRISYSAGYRCPGHDYRSRCIYHIVLNKTPGFPDFSEVIGRVESRQYKPVARPSALGTVIGTAISSLKSIYPFTSILRRCIMPDHVHFALFVKEATEVHLGTIIGSLKTQCSHLLEDSGYPPETRLFEENYHDTFLTDNGQLKKMLDYISDNPRRHLVRIQNPGWFRRFQIVGALGTFQAYGNWDLLAEFQKAPVRVSRKYTDSEYQEWRKRWYKIVNNDGILVSPFIHPKEKLVRDWAIKEKAALIYLTYKDFPNKFKPSGAMYDACGEGRLLIVSVPPLGAEALYLYQNGHPSYSHCQRMNRIAASIAADTYHPLLS